MEDELSTVDTIWVWCRTLGLAASPAFGRRAIREVARAGMGPGMEKGLESAKGSGGSGDSVRLAC